MRRIFLLLIGLFISFNLPISFSAPHKIILIRHADKLTQTDSGDTLSAKVK